MYRQNISSQNKWCMLDYAQIWNSSIVFLRLTGVQADFLRSWGMNIFDIHILFICIYLFLCMYDMHFYVNKMNIFIPAYALHCLLYLCNTCMHITHLSFIASQDPKSTHRWWLLRMSPAFRWFQVGSPNFKAHNKRSSNVLDMFDGLSLMFLMDL